MSNDTYINLVKDWLEKILPTDPKKQILFTNIFIHLSNNRVQAAEDEFDKFLREADDYS